MNKEVMISFRAEKELKERIIEQSKKENMTSSKLIVRILSDTLGYKAVR